MPERPEPIPVVVDGRTVPVPPGTLLAAALAEAGVTQFRRSVLGEPRGPLCGMGVCLECRATVNGQPHQRTCLTRAAAGTRVDTGEPAGTIAAAPHPMAVFSHDTDVLVVGAGPAGLAAACAAAEAGRRVIVLDNGPRLGGQVWRPELGGGAPTEARRWFSRLKASGARVFQGATVFAAVPGKGLLVELSTGLGRFGWRQLVLASGARERFLPFPGWTLPGVVGPGGLQAMVKGGWPIAGKRVVVAGSGPLLLAVAAGLKRHGARIPLIAEQAPRARLVRFGLGLWRQPAKLGQGLVIQANLLGVPYRCGTWPVRAEGDGRVQAVTLSDGRRVWTEPCDVLACGFHLVPNLELPRHLGCSVRQGVVTVNDHQETSVPGIFCAGEPTGIAGADNAVAEGFIAGLAAAGRPALAGTWLRRRAAGHRFRAALAEAFRLRSELRDLCTQDTIVCRCEDVRRHELERFDSWRAAKLHTRCGMGACQGRICGAATRFLFGWEPDAVRPPVFPVPVGVWESALMHEA